MIPALFAPFFIPATMPAGDGAPQHLCPPRGGTGVSDVGRVAILAASKTSMMRRHEKPTTKTKNHPFDEM